MRFDRHYNGRLELRILDEPDFDVARAVARAILTTFRGRQHQPLLDVDGSSFLDIDVIGGRVTVHVSYYMDGGTSVFAADEESDGLIYDIANYLAAHTAELGIELTA